MMSLAAGSFKGGHFHALAFQSAKEALHERAIITIPFPAHAHDDAVLREQLPIVSSGIPIRSRCRKLAVEQVGSHRLLVLAIGRSGAMPAWLRTQSVLMHEPCYPLLPARLAFGSQHGVNARASIHLSIRVIDAHDALPQPWFLPAI